MIKSSSQIYCCLGRVALSKVYNYYQLQDARSFEARRRDVVSSRRHRIGSYVHHVLKGVAGNAEDSDGVAGRAGEAGRAGGLEFSDTHVYEP